MENSMDLNFLEQKKKYKWKHRLKTTGVILLSPVLFIIGILYVVFVLWPIVGYDFLCSMKRTRKDSDS
jgi:Sec-independent protein secretion pathway component TatC